MIQKSLFVFIFLAFSARVFSQSFSLDPGDTIEREGYMEDLHTLTIIQENLTTDTLHLKWEKILAKVPPNWDASVCDNKICYATLVDSGVMNPVPPGESGVLYLKITPHVNEGTSTIRYVVKEIGGSWQRDTLTFILSAAFVSTKNINNNRQLVYPNPASRVLYFNFIDEAYPLKVILYDLKGDQVLSGNIVKGETLDISTLKNGLYILKTLAGSFIETQKIFVK